MTGEELGSDLVQARAPHFLLHHSIHDILYISTLQKDALEASAVCAGPPTRSPCWWGDCARVIIQLLFTVHDPVVTFSPCTQYRLPSSFYVYNA